MRITSRGSGIGLSLIIFLISILFTVMAVFLFLGFSLLSTAGVEYIKELNYQKKTGESVTAVITDVDRTIDGDTIIGYEILSYDYNGQHYETKVQASIESHSYFSSSDKEENEEDQRERAEKSEEHWKELKESVGSEQTIMIDPDNPSEPFVPSDESVVRALRNMSLVGLALLAVPVILIIVIVIIIKKIIKKKRESLSSMY